MSILYSNVTYILLFLTTMVIVGVSYAYIFYYNHLLADKVDINTLRKILFWGLTSSAIIISIVFCIYVSFRMFRPFASVVATAVVAGAIPAVIPVETTVLTTVFTEEEMKKIRKEMAVKYGKIKDGNYSGRKKTEFDNIRTMINNNEGVYKTIRDKNKTPESVYKLYELTNTRLDRFIGS